MKMMSLKDIINKKIGVTHATVLVFIWVSLSIMEQFVLYEPIPLENIGFFIVVLFAVLKSKDQDRSSQQLLTVEGDKIEVTTEFDSLMRSMREALNKYERFFNLTEVIKTRVKAMSDEEKDVLTDRMREADSEEGRDAAVVILTDALTDEDVKEQQDIADGGPW